MNSHTREKVSNGNLKAKNGIVDMSIIGKNGTTKMRRSWMALRSFY